MRRRKFIARALGDGRNVGVGVITKGGLPLAGALEDLDCFGCGGFGVLRAPLSRRDLQIQE